MGKIKKELLLLTFLSAIGGFLFGYDTGVISGAMLLMEEDERLSLTTVWKELIVSATVGAAWLFALIGGPATERFGRRPVILAASFIFTVGAVVMGVALDKYTLLVGRIIVGAGIGFASMSVPIYISEAAPPQYRGLLVSCNVLVITFGQFVAACVAGAFSTVTPDGWKYMLGLAGVPSLIQMIGFYFMPESPRWLISKGKVSEAKTILFKIRTTDDDPQKELDEILEVVEAEKELSDLNFYRTFVKAMSTPPVRRAVVLGCLLQLFQQVAGINTVMYYSAKIISMAGISDNSQAIWISAGVASVNFFCTFIGLFLVERIGRRKLLLASLAGVVVSLAFLAGGFQLTDIYSPDVTFVEKNATISGGEYCSQFTSCGKCTNKPDCGFCFLDVSNLGVQNGSCVDISSQSENFASFGRCSEGSISGTDDLQFAPDYCPSDLAWIVVLGLCSYLFFFAPGMGPMPWTINSEIYPLWARSLGNSLATSTNWAFNLIVSMTFLSLTEAITKHGTFYLYMCVALLGFVVFYFILPETAGRTLEEIEELFARPTNLPWRRTHQASFTRSSRRGGDREVLKEATE